MKRFLIILTALCCFASAAFAEIIPSEGVVKSFYSYNGMQARYALVLCERLTVRQSPDYGASAVTRLSNGDVFLTWQTHNGWVNVYRSDGSLNGWTRAEYLLMDPSYYVTANSMPAYAFAGSDAPRVGLIATGEVLPIIRAYADGYIVSLRGAAAYLRRADERQTAQSRLISARMDYRAIGTPQSEVLQPYSSYELTDAAALAKLEGILSPQTVLSDKPKCMFGSAYLTLKYSTGAVITFDMAVDGCANYWLNGQYFSYRANASSTELFALFGGMKVLP